MKGIDGLLDEVDSIEAEIAWRTCQELAKTPLDRLEYIFIDPNGDLLGIKEGYLFVRMDAPLPADVAARYPVHRSYEDVPEWAREGII